MLHTKALIKGGHPMLSSPQSIRSHRLGGLMVTASLVVCMLLCATRRSAAQDPLEELLRRAQEGVTALREPGAEPSAITMLWLSAELATDDELKVLTDRAITAARLSAATTLAELKVEGVKPGLLVQRLNLSQSPVDERFPINLAGLKASLRSPLQREQLSAAKAALILSYRGDSLKGGAQLKLICAAAQSVFKSVFKGRAASGEAGLLISLESRSALEPEALSARCAALSGPRAASEWARPDIEALEGGQLRLVSRGLAQLGRPELELGPLKPEQARELWPAFQEALQRGVAQTAQLSLSDEPCARPSYAYEGRCVRLSAVE